MRDGTTEVPVFIGDTLPIKADVVEEDLFVLPLNANYYVHPDFVPSRADVALVSDCPMDSLGVNLRGREEVNYGDTAFVVRQRGAKKHGEGYYFFVLR